MRRSISCSPNLIALVACLCLSKLVVLADPAVLSDKISFERIRIFVNVLDGPTFSMLVEPEQTVWDVRSDIYELESIPYAHITPKIGDTVLTNYDGKLSDNNIRDGTTLTLEIPDSWCRHTVQFHVRTLDGRELPVETHLGNLVSGLKDNITQWTGIPQIEQRLLLKGIELRDERKLVHYDISNEIILKLGRPLEDCRQVALITVNFLSGAKIEVEVDFSDTVTRLKEKIHEKTGVPPGVQILSFNERIIAGESHLCDLELKAGSNVYMVLYTPRITNLDQVARLQEQPATYSINPYNAPIFREADETRSSASGSRAASFYKDRRNWLSRQLMRPNVRSSMFDPVAYLWPNPDSEFSIERARKDLDELTGPNSTESDRVRAVFLRGEIKLSETLRPYRVAANLTSSDYKTKYQPCIALGGGSYSDGSLRIPLEADVNNWAPDALSDSDLTRLFEVSKRVRELFAKAESTGEVILSIASQRRLNGAILLTYIQALAGYLPPILLDQPREGEECPICMDDITAEPAVRLACDDPFHADCLYSWLLDFDYSKNVMRCPYCKEKFMFPYEAIGKAEMESPELQVNRDE